MDDELRLRLIVEAVLYCRRVRAMGMPASAYAKALREPVHFLWERRRGPKDRAARCRSRSSVGIARGTGQLVYDHAIPFRYQQEALLALADPSPGAVKPILEMHEIAALITKGEDSRLRTEGLGNKMPPGWRPGGDPLARYREIGLELVPQPQ